MLNWKRFVSDTWRSYQKTQLDVIRANSDPKKFITTNTMGWFDGFDHYTVTQDLDFVSWDNYVGRGHLDPGSNGALHDLTRGFKRKNFWVIETQPGSVNWASRQQFAEQRRDPRDGVACRRTRRRHDFVLAVAQRVERPGAISRHDPRAQMARRCRSIRRFSRLGAEFAKAAPALAGTSPKSEVAILHSYESRWAIQWQRHNIQYDPAVEIVSYYRPLRAISQSIDIVAPTAPLKPVQTRRRARIERACPMRPRRISPPMCSRADISCWASVRR